MSKKTIKNTINLLDPIGSPNDAWTVAYEWVFKVGRYLLVVIEVLVLGVFFARFVLDKKNNDLTEEINDKVEILSNETFKNNEVLFGNLHMLFNDIQTLDEDQPKYSQEVATIISSIPDGLTLEGFSFSTKRVTLSLIGSDFGIIKDYEFSLRQNTSKYSEVLFNISKSGREGVDIEVGVSFVLTELIEE